MHNFAAMSVFLFLAWAGLGWFLAMSSPSLSVFSVSRAADDQDRSRVSVPLVLSVLVTLSGTFWYLADLAR